MLEHERIVDAWEQVIAYSVKLLPFYEQVINGCIHSLVERQSEGGEGKEWRKQWAGGKSGKV